MKKSVCCMCLLLAMLLSACGVRQTAEALPPDADSSGSPRTPASVPPDPAVVIPEILRDVLGPSQSADALQQREILERLKNLGLPVLIPDENMLNYRPVADFLEGALAGKDGEVTVYLYPDARISSRTFSCQGGKMTCAYTDYAFGGAEKHAPEAVDFFSYTKKGNFIYHTEGASGSEGNQMGFRVLPLSEKSREYYRKYIVPGDIFAQGPLNGSWNSKDYSAINWEWEFEGVWKHTTGKWMVDPASSYYVAPPDNAGFDSVKLPADIVEGLLQKYFDVPTETLRALGTYDKETNTYNFAGFRGGGYSSALEVSKWRENPDGSLTFWVDFVSLEFGKELSAQSMLTVMPSADGSFKYLSNVFTKG